MTDEHESELNILRLLRKHLPSTHILTTGLEFTDKQLEQIMSIGVSGHINRALSKPRDVVNMVANIAGQVKLTNY